MKNRTGAGMSTTVIALAAGALLMLAAGMVSGAAEFYVAPSTATPAGDDDNDGSADAPFATIAKGITQADAAIGGGAASATIHLADGIYLEHGLQLTNAITIKGSSGNRDAAIINANSAGRAFMLSHDGAMLANLTVMGGRIESGEGANISITATATVTNCVISGGTVFVSGGRGGNIYMTGAGLIVDSKLLGGSGNNNNSSVGYSIWASAGRVMRCIVSGGAYTRMNSSPIYLDGAVTMENCLVTGNSSSGSGAIVYVNHASATVVNCTIVGNTAGTYGGIYLAAAGQVFNTVIYNNGGTAAKEWGGVNGGRFVYCATAEGLAISGGMACIAAVTDDAFVNYGTDYTPAPGGVLENVGARVYYDTYASSTTDFSGNPRRIGVIDIGCHEAQPSSLTVLGSASAGLVAEGNDVTLTAEAFNGTGSITYSWNVDGGGFVDGAAEKILSGLSVGDHTVVVKATDSSAATDEYDFGTIRVVGADKAVLADLYVSPNGSDTEGAGAQDNPFGTIAKALSVLAANDVTTATIHPAAGVYVEYGMTLSSAITITGGTGNAEDVIVNAHSHGRAFTLSDAGAMLANLTVTGGRITSGHGANISMTAAATITNCVISGGVVAYNTGTGGNIYMTGAGLIVDSRISGGSGNGQNSCAGYSIWASAGRLMRCAVVNGAYGTVNSSPIYLNGAVTLENCLIAGNRSSGSGAIVFVNNTSAKVVNCTIAGNTTGTYGGIYLAAAGKVYNTVIYNNGGTAAKEWGGVNGGSFYNCATASGVAITSGVDCQTLDAIPLNVFEDTTDWVPLGSTPLMDNGNYDHYTAYALSATDFVRFTRKSGSGIDIGCHEYDQSTLSVSGGSDKYAAHVGEDVTITCLIVGGEGVTSYDFDFGDGTTALGVTSDTKVHQYSQPGYYTVSVTGYRGEGEESFTLATPIRVVPFDIYVSAADGLDEGERTQGRDTTITPFKTVKYALNSLTNALSIGVPAIGGVTIHVADGAYAENGMTLGKGIVIQGNAADRTAVKIGASGNRVFTLSHGDDVLRHLTVQNGSGRDANGGNINMSAGTITNCVVSDGRLFHNNALSTGGNIHMTGGLVVDCVIRDAHNPTANTKDGFNVWMSGGRIMRCIISGATGSGGPSSGARGMGLWASGGVCENSLFTGLNNSLVHAAVYIEGGAKVVNCTVISCTGNTRSGVWSGATSAMVVNTVIYNNGGTAEKEWGNANASCFIQCATSAGAAFTGGTGNISTLTDAAFVNYEEGDYRPALGSDSPLANAGGEWADYLARGAISETDLNGFKRLSERTLDIGCYERQAPQGTLFLMR